jgi:hypothetical protein
VEIPQLHTLIREYPVTELPLKFKIKFPLRLAVYRQAHWDSRPEIFFSAASQLCTVLLITSRRGLHRKYISLLRACLLWALHSDDRGLQSHRFTTALYDPPYWEEVLITLYRWCNHLSNYLLMTRLQSSVVSVLRRRVSEEMLRSRVQDKIFV